MLHKFFLLLWVKEWALTFTEAAIFEFYARWPPEIDHNLFAMVFETLMPIPATMPKLKNLAPSARSIWIPPPLKAKSSWSQYNVRRLICSRITKWPNLSVDPIDNFGSSRRKGGSLSAEELRAKAAVSKLEDGNIRAAVLIICSSDEPAADSVATLNALIAKHPDAPAYICFPNISLDGPARLSHCKFRRMTLERQWFPSSWVFWESRFFVAPTFEGYDWSWWKSWVAPQFEFSG